jgi:hypothetical protein
MGIHKEVKNMKRRKYSIYDAFETKGMAKSSAKDLRIAGDTAMIRKISPQGGEGGRLKWGLFTAGRRKRK